jgi:hypothetical protein
MIDKTRDRGYRSKLAPVFQDHRIACSPDGAVIFAADGPQLTVYALETDGERPALRKKACIKAPGRITHVVGGRSSEPILAVEREEGAALMRLIGGTFRTFTELGGAPRDVLEGENGVFVLTAPRAGRPAEVVRLDSRTGIAEMSAPVSAGVARLRRARGTAVLAVDPRGRSVRRIDLDAHCRNDVPPRDHCEDGDDGLDDGCIIYVATGAGIVRRNICDPGRNSCHRTLHSRIERMELVGSTLFAVTRRGRTVEALDEARFPSARSMPCLAPVA